MIHVAEDSFEHLWKPRDWYCERKFQIVDGDKSQSAIVRQRKAVWGQEHFAERTLAKNLLKEGILRQQSAGEN